MIKFKYESLTGFVLRSVEYNEYDRLESIYSQQSGLILAHSKSIRKKEAKLVSIIVPFKLINVDLVKGNTLPIIKGGNILQSYKIKRFSSIISALAINEALISAIMKNEPSESIFNFLNDTYKLLVNSKNPYLILAYSIYKLLGILGYNPSVNLDSGINKITLTRHKIGFNLVNSQIVIWNNNSKHKIIPLNVNVYKLIKLFSGININSGKKNRRKNESLNNEDLFKYSGDWSNRPFQIKETNRSFAASSRDLYPDYLEKIKIQPKDLIVLLSYLQRFYLWHIGKTLNSLEFVIKSM